MALIAATISLFFFCLADYSIAASIFATIGAALAALAMVLEMTFIVPLGGNSIGAGFIIGIIVVFVLSFLAIHSCWKTDKMYKEKDELNPCRCILCCCKPRTPRA